MHFRARPKRGVELTSIVGVTQMHPDAEVPYGELKLGRTEPG